MAAAASAGRPAQGSGLAPGVHGLQERGLSPLAKCTVERWLQLAFAEGLLES